MRRRDLRDSDDFGNGHHAPSFSSTKPLQRLKRLDMYARPKPEFQRGTLHGSIVTCFLVVAITSLTWREFRFSMQIEYPETLFVNSTTHPSVSVTFDVEFPSISCDLITFDAEDATGAPLKSLKHDMTKTRLDGNGRRLDRGHKHLMGGTLKEAIALEEAADTDRTGNESNAERNKDGDDCNCYGAGAEGECCRTCQDVRAAYRRKGWKLNTKDVPVCSGVGSDREPLTSRMDRKEHEGCRLAGYLEVPRTEGNFHFAPGYRLHRSADSLSMVDHMQIAMEAFDTTHTIHNLTFWDPPRQGHGFSPEAASSGPLEGQSRVIKDAHGMYQYYVHIVPTTYRYLDGTTSLSGRYSVTEHFKHIDPGPLNRGLPGVYFHFHISPVQALVQEYRRGFLAFLTGACGVIGGVYTLLGLINTGVEGLTGRRGGRSL